MNMHDLRLRLRALVFRNLVEDELDEELRFHVEMQTRKYVASGLREGDARRRALADFGHEPLVKEECRDARRIRLIETIRQDVLYAIRGFRRSPTFVVTVVATIALGVGLNTALFTVFNSSYFCPLPVRDPQSLYEFFWTDRAGGGHSFTWREYQEFLAANPAFCDALAYRQTEARLDGRQVFGIMVTGGYFRMLGVGAALGRTLLPEDSVTPGREPAIVLAYTAWKSYFAGNPDIIGKMVLLRGYPFEVVGVAPQGFEGLGKRPTDFWAPITMAAQLDGGLNLFGSEQPRSLEIVGRLTPGFSIRQAQAGVTIWAQRFTAQLPDAEKAAGATFISRATRQEFSLKNVLLFSPVMIAFALVLLIACANVANMMLARAMSRQREIGIRLSLGAARGRLVRQLLTESILLVLPAAIAGIAVSQAMIWLCVRVLFATVPPGISGFLTKIPQLSSDVRVFGFSLAVALVSALLFGLAPAVQATHTNVMQTARGDFAGELRPSQLRNSLVVGQITVCVFLLIIAGILLRGVDRIKTLDSGLSTRDAVEITVQEKSRGRVLDRLSSEPAVEILGAAGKAPVDRKFTVRVTPAGEGSLLGIAANTVSPEYFTIFEIPIVRGRNFTNEEARSGAPVAIISHAAAQQLWPNQDAVGRRLRLLPDPNTETGLRLYQVVSVIGIARDEISRWIASGDEKALVYLPSNPQAAGSKLLVRVHGDAETTRRRLDDEITAIDPNAIDEIRRIQIQEWVREEAYSFRVAHWGTSAIGVLALLLTLSGIYGVLSCVVSQRTKEIGIRMAMGATTRSIAGLVLKQSMRLAIVGTAFGGVLALGVSRILASNLVMLNTLDGAAHIGGVLLVLAACAAAAYFPSRRAARIDPIRTLRYD